LDNLENKQIEKTMRDNYTEHDFFGGQKRLANFFFEKVIKTPDDKMLICCTDTSRKKFKILDLRGNLKEDIEARQLCEKLKVPTQMITKEIYDKVIIRVKNIEDFLNYFGDIQYVNQTKILKFEVVLEKCKNIIINYYNTLNRFEYNIIIGDCNFSNILINPNNIDDIIFIDPRGYFGNTSIFGLKEYDYSKILYGISGYDNFNSNFFNIKNINIEKKSINFDIKPINFNKKYINKYFNKVHKAFMIIHWLSLADYNKNNIWKCLTSYYYGLYLGTLL
jgi:hypothetical protein